MNLIKRIVYIFVFLFIAIFISNETYATASIPYSGELNGYFNREQQGNDTVMVPNVEALEALSDDELYHVLEMAIQAADYCKNLGASSVDDKTAAEYERLRGTVQQMCNDRGISLDGGGPVEEVPEEEILGYTTLDQLNVYLRSHDVDELSDEAKDHFYSIIDSNRGTASRENESVRQMLVFCQARMHGLSIPDAEALASDTSFLQSNASSEVYQEPGRTNTTATGSTSIDDVISQGDGFEASGTGTVYNQDNLQNFSKSLYNILLAIGVAASVIIGMTLGIKFTMAGVDEKADIKKQLFIYVAGCVIVFGAFAIWKLAVDIFAQI